MSCPIGRTLWMALLLVGSLAGLQSTASAAQLYGLQGVLVAPVVNGSIDFSQPLTGSVSHLGPTVVTAYDCDSNTCWTLTVTGGTLITAATSWFEGTSESLLHPNIPGELHLDAEFTIVGGTGRYENASGFIDVSGSILVTAPYISLDVSGGLVLP